MGTIRFVCYEHEKNFERKCKSYFKTDKQNYRQSIRKIFFKVYDSKGNKGSGFLCKIPFPDEFHLLPVLITNNHVLNEEELTKNIKIKISFYDDKITKIINIFPERKIYTSVKYDISIIEIFPEKDDIKNFLDVEIISE